MTEAPSPGVGRVEGPSGGYEIVREVGRGGFGVTCLARREADGLEVALKMLHIERLRDWKALELFEREAQVLKGLVHPSIPGYVDYFPLGDPACPAGFVLVQEYVAGTTLAQRMRSGPRLDERAMLGWLNEILEVLDHLHRLSPPVIHRDISPKNIMLRESDGRAFLIDFGTVQAAVRAAQVGSTAAGTFGYAPLEQFLGRAFPASDLYGLGMTYLAVLCGVEPEQMAQAGVRVDVRQTVAGLGVDARLSLLLEEMTEPDVARRLSSAFAALEKTRLLARRFAPPAPSVTIAPASSPVAVGAAGAPRTVRHGEAPAAVTGTGTPARTSTPPVAAHKCSLSRLEDLREAAARQSLIPDGTALCAPPRLPRRTVEHLAVSEDGSRLLLVAYEGCHVVRVGDLSRDAVLCDSIADRSAGFSANGRLLAILDRYRSALHLCRFDGAEPVWRRITQSRLKGLDSASRVAISPDGSLVAAGAARTIFVLDWESGNLISTMNASVEQGLFFTPDSAQLIACGSQGATLFGRAGDETHLASQLMAVSPDGSLMACVKTRSSWHLELGPFRTLSLPTEILLPKVDDGVGNLRFSPDGRWLALSYESGSTWRIALIDTAQRKVARMLGDPHRPGGFVEVHGLGFTSDSTRLVALVEGAIDRFSDEIDTGVQVFSIEHGWCVGTLVVAAPGEAEARSRTQAGVYSHGKRLPAGQAILDDTAPVEDATAAEDVVVALAGYGFHGVLPPTRSLHGESPELPFERAEIAHATLSGQAIDANALDEADFARYLDYEARVGFFRTLEGCRASGDELRMLVDATRGLTPLLPRIVEEAREAQRDQPRFGQKSNRQSGLLGGAICKVAARYAARSGEERSVLIEDALAALAVEEARRHEEAAVEEQRRHEEAARLEGEAAREAELARRRQRETDEQGRLTKALHLFEMAQEIEQREDGRWIRRKQYGQALSLATEAVKLGLVEAREVVERLTEKIEGQR